jgi:hypothetical protein
MGRRARLTLRPRAIPPFFANGNFRLLHRAFGDEIGCGEYGAKRLKHDARDQFVHQYALEMHSLRNAKKIEAAARGGGARRESTPTRAVRDTDYAAGGARGR